MSNAFASHFERIGMTADEARSRAALFQELEERGGTVLNGPPEWYRFSPGRIEIFGKHTDYAGGHSLLAAVPRGIALVARSRTDGVVRVGDIRDGQIVEIDPSADAPPEYRGLRRYVHVVARRLFLNFPGCELGAEIAIASDLPRASGLSSSSALVVGVAAALIARARLAERDEWHRQIAKPWKPDFEGKVLEPNLKLLQGYMDPSDHEGLWTELTQRLLAGPDYWHAYEAVLNHDAIGATLLRAARFAVAAAPAVAGNVSLFSPPRPAPRAPTWRFRP